MALGLYPGCSLKGSSRELSGRWESGNPALGFPLSHGPQFLFQSFDSGHTHEPSELWKCGSLAFCARFPRSCGKGGKPAFGFPGFPQLRHFHSSPSLSSQLHVGPRRSPALSCRHAGWPQNTEAVQRRGPILHRHGPFLRRVPQRQVQQFQGRLIIGK